MSELASESVSAAGPGIGKHRAPGNAGDERQRGAGMSASEEVS